MAGFNGSGTFVRTYNWTNDANNSIKIRADRMDTEDNGFATGLSTVICKDGQTTTTAIIPFAAGLSFPSGSAATPLLSVISDSTTGIYASAAGKIDFTSSGVRVGGWLSTGLSVVGDVGCATVTSSGAISGTNITSSVLFKAAAGAAAAPSITFTANTADGFYSAGAGQVNVTTNGVLRFTFADATCTVANAMAVTGDFAVNTNKFTVAASSGNTLVAGTLTTTGVAKFATGAAAAPSITFTANAADGFYNIGSGQIGVATTGALRLTIADALITCTIPLKLKSYAVASLPAAATAGAGATAFVTDANATTFASIVAAGGANGVPVYSDGTNWRIG